MNKFFVVGSIIILFTMSSVLYLKAPEFFEGKVDAKKCVQTAKSRDSVELYLVRNGLRKRFVFGVKGSTCDEALLIFNLNDDVKIDYHSLNDSYATVDKLSLNGRQIPLRGQ
ncbi:hypothetical protein KP803_06840 [Vibrio sp. ZSDE26]|uniref:Uncharacterized protein n=1 Tax=Vibrio amylolyticus TaxID=2847292 RepID=A0A9X1XJ19_9VIBR|nr:hypothetical protein [Vibrio amylolyticus]MCK6262995.1 hypothetical protein [Vibrio amylolyticus]